MLAKRKSGVLLHISSLPGKYGIGCFSKEAYAFIDFLSEASFSYWQVLPFTPIDECSSPYKSISAFAGNTHFIDLDALIEDGLLREDQCKVAYYTTPYTVEYESLVSTRTPLLKIAYENFIKERQKELDTFLEENHYWLPDYAIYMTLLEKNNGMHWQKWADIPLKNHEAKAISNAILENNKVFYYHVFLQYQFQKQWKKVKAYAHHKNIRIIGDIPIYVCDESSDTWSHRDLFKLDNNGYPTQVGGVPPDYFSEDGQLWGNPLYDWKAMKKNHYTWWKERLTSLLSQFDLIRLDHFRGFSAFWSVKYGETTARNGEWIKGPGIHFFKSLFEDKRFNKHTLFAETLGVNDESLQKLIKKSKLSDMRVLQFGFISEADNEHLPHHYSEDSIAYTGTHDNNTLLGWLWELTPERRKTALEYVNFDSTQIDWKQGGPHSPSSRAFIRALWQSSSRIVIVPIQDLCGYGSDTKMNSPGVPKGNWSFRVTKEGLSSIDITWLQKLNQLYKRENDPSQNESSTQP